MIFLKQKPLLSFIFISLWLMPQAYGASSEGIPVSFLLFQVLNFSIFCAISAYLLIKKSPAFFQARSKDYLLKKEEAKKLYQKAELDLKSIKKKILELEENKKTFDSQVEKQILLIEKRIQSETLKQSEIILKIAKNFIHQERIKTQTLLKKEFIEQIEFLCCGMAQKKPQNISSFFNGSFS